MGPGLPPPVLTMTMSRPPNAATAQSAEFDGAAAPVLAQPLAPAPNPGPHAHQDFDLDRPLREARDSFEKAYFEFHLVREGGSMTRVAEKTGLERTHLYRKLRQLGVDLGRGKRN